jgi:site-specific DNA-methyltransferase (cytosine-N4-specific)
MHPALMSRLTTHEVAERAGVHKLTLIRWMKQGIVPEPQRDWRGWRTFDDEQAREIESFAKGERAIGVPIDPALSKLASIDWTFADAKTNYLTHGLHPYPAKFIPQIPNALIQELSSVGDTVADIFCGSGTTLLEALLLKRHAIGIDANPLSILISRAKTAAPTEADLDKLMILLGDCRQLAVGLNRSDSDLFGSTVPFVSKGWRPEASVSEFWFDPHVVEELAELRLRILDLPPTARVIAQVVFSSIIVTVSRQDSDTRYVRREKCIEPGETVRRFCRGIELAIATTSEVSDILEPRFSCRFLNSDILSAPDVPNIDLVVSSPPYPNAFSYHLYHRTRLLWLGYDQKRFKADEIGSHRKYSAKGAKALDESDFAREFGQIFRWLAERMTAGKYACFVIGNSTIKGRTVDNAELLNKAAAVAGFSRAAVVDRDIPSTRKAFNPAHGRIKTEKILILRRQS